MDDNQGSKSGLFDIDFDLGNVQAITLSGAASANLINAESGASYVLTITQGSSGGNELTFIPPAKWAYGVSYTPSINSGSIDIINLIYANGEFYGASMSDMS